MDEKLIAFIIVLVTASIPCVVLGYLIAIKEKHALISGWNAKRISNAKAYGQWIGFSTMLLGLLLLFVTGMWYANFITENTLVIALITASLLPVLCAIIAKIKYQRKT